MKSSRKYKKVLVSIFFLVFIYISFILLSYLFRPVTISRKNVCGFYAEEKNTLDVVFVGGSVCYTSWEPLSAWNQHGFTSYNFAIDALQPQVIKYALEEVQKTQSPEVFVIDLRPFQYGDLVSEQENLKNMERVAPFRNFSDNIKYSQNRIAAINEGAPRQEERWTYYFDISKYHGGIYALASIENWSYILNEKKLYTKGFDCYKETNPILFYDMREITEELTLEEELDVLLIGLLEYCNQEDLEVLFLVGVHGGLENDQKKYNYMERKITEYGFNYLNLNNYTELMRLDFETDFYDVDHVNLMGADKHTAFLGEYLTQHYDLPDKRSDEQYNQWNLDYEKWNMEMEIVRDTMRQAK